MKILVTGSKGYLGRPLVEALSNKGHSVIECDLQMGCNLNKPDDLDSVIGGVDIVINLAAMGDLYDVMDDVEAGFQANVEAVRKLGQKCLANGTRLIHASTCCVYGNQENSIIIDEETTPHPSEIYAIQKLESEQILLEMEKKGLSLVIARLGTIYGGNMRNSQVFYRFIMQNLRGEPIVIHGNGNQERSYTYIDDIISGIIILAKNTPADTIYNVVSEEPISVNKLADTIENLTSKRFFRINIADRPGQFHNQNIQAKRIHREFNWKADTTLQEGLKKLVSDLMHEVELENYSSTVPCIHRIHENEQMLSPSHKIQVKLGFSKDIESIKSTLLKIVKKMDERKIMLVTFDDGYKDIILLEPFFDSHPEFQPVLAISTSTLNGESLWFDRLYCFLATADNETINGLAKEHNIPISEDVRELLAKSKMKTDLRVIPHALQEKRLSELIISAKLPEDQYLTAKDLRRLVKKGWIIASHSHHHSQLTCLSDVELKYELKRSLQEILNLGGRAWLVYPDGVWNRKVFDIAFGLGYTKFFTLDNASKIMVGESHIHRTLI